MEGQAGHGAVFFLERNLRRAVKHQISHYNDVVRLGLGFPALFGEGVAVVYPVLCGQVVVIFAELGHGEFPPVVRKLSVQQQRRHNPQQGRQHRRPQQNPPGLFVLEHQDGVRLPCQLLAVLTGIVAFEVLHPLVDGNSQAHAPHQHQAGALIGVGIAEPSPVGVRHPKAPDGLARGGAQAGEEHRLQQEHGGHGQHQKQQAPPQACPGHPEPQGQKQGAPENPV